MPPPVTPAAVSFTKPLITTLILKLLNSFDGQAARNQFLKNEIQKLDIEIAEIKTLNDYLTHFSQLYVSYDLVYQFE